MSFRTTPSWTWPGWSESSSFWRASSFSRSSTSPAAQHEVPPHRIGLGDQAGHPLADELGQVLDPIDGDLADGDEAADMVDLAFESAGVVAGHLGLDEHAFVQVGPVAHVGGRLGKPQIVEPVVGVEPLDDHLDGVARLGRRWKLPQGHAALLAAAQFDEHLVAPHGDDAAGVPRFRLEGLFVAEHVAAAHQGVERRVAQGPVKFGVHVLRGRCSPLGRGRASARHSSGYRRRTAVRRGTASLPERRPALRRRRGVGDWLPAAMSPFGGAASPRFDGRLLDGSPIALPPAAIGRRIALRADENGRRADSADSSFERWLGRGIWRGGRRPWKRLVAGTMVRIDACQCWSP